MNTQSQKICAFLGVLTPLIMFCGFIAAGFFPPLEPSLDVNSVNAYYMDNKMRVLLGSGIMQLAGGGMIVFTAVIAAQLRRIEHRKTPVLTYIQLGAGFVTAIPFIIGALIWITAAFRPDRPPELVLLMSDLGWILFLGFWFPTPVQNIAIGAVILSDKKQKPNFPRWVGYFCFWESLVFPAAMIMPFFVTGPFAWNGLFPFWLPAIAFGSWFLVMYIFLLKSIKQQETEETVT